MAGRPTASQDDHLALIAEMARAFAASGDVDACARQGLDRIAAVLEAEAASLFLLEDGGTLVCRACHGPVDVAGLRLPPGHGLIGRAVLAGTSQIVNSVSDDPDFRTLVDDSTGFRTRSILTAPITVGADRLGAIQVINKLSGNGHFAAGDRHILDVLATAFGLSILNARHTAAVIEQERMHRELELAADIQRSLLPRFEHEDEPIFGLNIPARMVSGDFYDSGRLPDGRRWFVLGDVSGKGMNAALLMAKTASVFRCLVKFHQRPGLLLHTVNAELCETSLHGMFVTMIAGILDPATGHVVLANAGHEPPLLLARDGETFVALPAEAPPVGIFADLFGAEGYPETGIDLDGGTLYIFSDGLTEAYTDGARTGMLGVDGVQDLILAHRDLPLRDRLRTIARIAAAPAPVLRDDLTLLAVEDGRKG